MPRPRCSAGGGGAGGGRRRQHPGAGRGAARHRARAGRGGRARPARPAAVRGARARLALLARALALEPPRVLSQLGALQARGGPAPCWLPHPHAAPCACPHDRPYSKPAARAAWALAAPGRRTALTPVRSACRTRWARTAWPRPASPRSWSATTAPSWTARSRRWASCRPRWRSRSRARPATRCTAPACACSGARRARACHGPPAGHPAGRSPACRGSSAPPTPPRDSGSCGGARVAAQPAGC